MADDGHHAVGIGDPVLHTTLQWLTDVFDSIKIKPRLRVVRIIDLEDAVRYFAENHPGDPKIAAGALLRLPHPRGHLLFQVFLDDVDRVCLDESGHPYGRRLVAKSLGRELGQRLAETDLVIFR
jgi:hypothetical protein